MKHLRRPGVWVAAVVTLASLGAVGVSCTDTYLYDERRDEKVPRDRSMIVEGQFCTPAPNDVVRPIKIVLAMDASLSMNITDPDGSRAKAVVELLNNLPQEREVYFTVLLFAGSTSAWLTKSGFNVFERVVDYSDDDKTQLAQRILNYVNTSTLPNRDSTDFIKPLDDIYALISADIGAARAMGATDETRARYSVIFLSDGQPTINQDDELLCGDTVRRLRDLSAGADDVTFNAVHVFIPNQPIASTNCTFDGGINVPVNGSDCRIPNLPPGTCPLLIINQDSERLQKMAALGGGNFRDFRNNEPINFLNFNFGQVRRNFVFDKLVASNFSAPADSPEDEADTDSDGLLDADELREGTSPFLADTDGDGFSDGVEVYYRSRGLTLTPNQVALPDGGGLDKGCPAEQLGLDSDCDGLSDCDEQLTGTNRFLVDSDFDGVSDGVEFKLGTQQASKDLDQDPDNDHLPNRDELLMHTNPLVSDSENLSVTGYRYEVVKDGGIDADGRQCFNFRISNVSLANTLPDTRDAGNPDGGAPFYRRGAGYNDIFVTTSMRAGDDPKGKTSLRIFRYQSARYPVGGIKSPHDGVIRIGPSDFAPGCRTLTPTTGP